jgi:hypothetical protein
MHAHIATDPDLSITGGWREEENVTDGTDELAYPTHEAFEVACQELLRKYPSRSAAGHIGPWRTNAGWEWREHRVIAPAYPTHLLICDNW